MEGTGGPAGLFRRRTMDPGGSPDVPNNGTQGIGGRGNRIGTMGDGFRVGWGPEAHEVDAGGIGVGDKVGTRGRDGGRADGNDIGTGAVTGVTRGRQRGDGLDSASGREAHVVTRRDSFLVVLIELEGLVVIVILVPLRGRRVRRVGGLGVVQPALGIVNEINPGVATRSFQGTAFR